MMAVRESLPSSVEAAFAGHALRVAKRSTVPSNKEIATEEHGWIDVTDPSVFLCLFALFLSEFLPLEMFRASGMRRSMPPGSLWLPLREQQCSVPASNGTSCNSLPRLERQIASNKTWKKQAQRVAPFQHQLPRLYPLHFGFQLAGEMTFVPARFAELRICLKCGSKAIRSRTCGFAHCRRETR